MRMIVKIIFPLVALLSAFAVTPAADAATGVLFDQPKILHEFFPEADRIEVRDVPITPELGAKLKARLGYLPVAPHYSVFVGRKGEHDLGYALIDEEKGMHEPITFAVLVGLDGAVERQEVMVYREPEGDGVTSRRFTRQF